MDGTKIGRATRNEANNILLRVRESTGETKTKAGQNSHARQPIITTLAEMNGCIAVTQIVQSKDEWSKGAQLVNFLEDVTLTPERVSAFGMQRQASHTPTRLKSKNPPTAIGSRTDLAGTINMSV